MAVVDDKPASCLPTLDVTSRPTVVKQVVALNEHCHILVVRLMDDKAVDAVVETHIVREVKRALIILVARDVNTAAINDVPLVPLAVAVRRCVSSLKVADILIVEERHEVTVAVYSVVYDHVGACPDALGKYHTTRCTDCPVGVVVHNTVPDRTVVALVHSDP
jgi:hypothetical protein